ncbi:MAG: hypothetical protein IJ529_04710 [Alphaproteobacteria bacterium]|nr:hypothetical protein [Alphaproteobacteria bacterium]MBQ9236176.1 hypothetical protein [Alphaproteobacteria bacterium]
MDNLYTQEEILDISKFGFGIRDLNSENHWHEATENFSFGDKKTILILPGSGTNSAEGANGMCKIAENMLPDEVKDKWQICSMYYSTSRINNMATALRAQMMFDKYFIPLIATKDENGDLHKLSEEKAVKNMRNLVIFTHCYGGYIMEAFEKQMTEVMQELGYSEKETSKIQKQLFVVQHNNIDRDLGNTDSKTTQLFRISKADEELSADDTYYGTFRHYTATTNNIGEDDCSYVKMSDNQRVLYAKRITQIDQKDQIDQKEHNGGYWIDKKYKTTAGCKEEEIFKIIFDEITTSNYPIENMEQVLKNAADKDAEKARILGQSLRKSFNDGYAEYKHKFNDGFKLLDNKLSQNKLTKKDILLADTDVLFMKDKGDKFLLDKLLDKQQYELATILFSKMAKNAKYDSNSYSKRLTFGGSGSHNKEDAKNKTAIWAQIAIDQQQTALFTEIASKNPKLWSLNYSKADENILSESLKYVFTKEYYPVGAYDQKKYLNCVISIYEANEKLPKSESNQQIRNTIENLLFNELKGSTGIVESCEKSGIVRLCNLAQRHNDKSQAKDKALINAR